MLDSMDFQSYARVEDIDHLHQQIDDLADEDQILPQPEGGGGDTGAPTGWVGPSQSVGGSELVGHQLRLSSSGVLTSVLERK